MIGRIFALILGVCLFVAETSTAQNVSFSAIPYGNNLWAGISAPHADLNGDGRDDLISSNGGAMDSGCAGAFAVVLSIGDGSYAAPVCYSDPSGDAEYFAVGDFNKDGVLDLVVSDGTETAFLFLNDGTGKLHLANTVTLPGGAYGVVAMDANHDGAMDLAYVIPTDYTSPQRVGVLFGENDGLFSVGPVSSFTTCCLAGGLFMGDFDGDGHGDLVIDQFFNIGGQVLFGDGAGNFKAYPNSAVSTGAFYIPVDVMGNGTMALIANMYDPSDGLPTNVLDIEFGHANRTLTSKQISLSASSQDPMPPLVADFDGDGIPDLIVAQGTGLYSDSYTLTFMKGNGDGTFQPAVAIYSTNLAFAEMTVLRATHSSRPDVLVRVWDDRPAVPRNFQEVLLLNTTTGHFPSCTPLNFRATGISVCGPTTSVVPASPVPVSFAGSGQTPGRDMEIWVDGKKAAQNRKYSFSNYDFIDANLALGTGAHTVSVFSVGWDYSLLLYQLPLTVGSTTCSPPATLGLSVCGPLQNGEISSPVTAWAAGNAGEPIARMEVWVDGVKQYTTHGSNTLKTQIAVSPGHHQFGYWLVGFDGKKWEQLRDVWVR